MIKKSRDDIMSEGESKYDDRIAQLERQFSALSEKSAPAPSRYILPPVEGKWIGLFALPLIIAIFLYLAKPQMVMIDGEKEKVLSWSALFKWDAIITAVLLISAYLYVYYDKKGE